MATANINASKNLRLVIIASDLIKNNFSAHKELLFFGWNYIVKILPAARLGKLSQIELYIKTLNCRKLELQWKRNSNEDYFRTINFIRSRRRNVNVSEGADYQHSKVTRLKDRASSGSSVQYLIRPLCPRIRSGRRCIYDISSCAHIPCGLHYRPKGETFSHPIVSTL